MDKGSREGRPWRNAEAPRRILVIRLQAVGDVVITLPYVEALKQLLPATSIDYLTRKEVEAIPRQISNLDKIHAIGGGRNPKLQYLAFLARLPTLRLRNYDLVVDLQNNSISRLALKLLNPDSWCRFDRFSPLPAGTRTKNTIESLGLGPLKPSFSVKSKLHEQVVGKLREAGWTQSGPLINLNPAGFFPTRNWPIENYLQFAKLWLESVAEDSQFLILGLDRVAAKAQFLTEKLNDRCINLVGQTTAAEAFAMIGHTDLVLSEDSGLMHMAWVSGVPTIALFGSSRGDWSRPLGEHTICLDSSDLPCGCCLREHCLYGDTRCLLRYSPREIKERAVELLKSLGSVKLLV